MAIDPLQHPRIPETRMLPAIPQAGTTQLTTLPPHLKQSTGTLTIIPGAKGATAPRSPMRSFRPRSLWRGAIWQFIVVCAVLGMIVAGITDADLPLNPLRHPFHAQGAARVIPSAIVAKVPTFTQVDPTIGYRSQQQYDAYWGAACSAAAAGEVLTAWGDPNASIGQLIIDLGQYLSPSDGLLDFAGFTQIAQLHSSAIQTARGLSPDQLTHIVRDYGYPVIVGVRAAPDSYYGYLAGGHFLVVTGVDAHGFQIVDSSMYYIHYLPTATFMSLWNADGRRAVLFTPPALQVSLT